ncbi:MAG: cobyrinate a,c-diamide synthase, partial [Nitrososphaera sp.]
MKIPRLVVGGVTSGVGKTTIAVAIMHALRKKGYRVQPFKVGPDFIDPSYHSLVTSKQSRNLDAWMMGRSGVLECFAKNCEGADMAVIEGVMGLFDGVSGKDNYASTAHIARILKAPVLLVVDAAKGARSIAAIVIGFLRFDRSVRIAGVILNNVAGDKHAQYLVDAIGSKAKIPIVGIIRRDNSIRMKERHLGLIPAQELQKANRRAIIGSSKRVSDQIRIDEVLRLCRTDPLPDARSVGKPKKNSAVIAVALDESFNFYYADNLDALRNSGARIEFFSPVNDRRLPENAQGVILGGGFPEVLAERLEKNSAMIGSLRKAVHDGMPLYAECGGLMYLTRSIRGYRGERRARKMAALVDADTVMTGRLTLNYTEATCDGPLLGRANLRGHEFHYSAIENIDNDSRYAYALSRGRGVAD